MIGLLVLLLLTPALLAMFTIRKRPALHREPLYVPPGRGTGLTMHQMLEAPLDAIYIWPNSNLHYPRNLARFLGRHDLVVISESAFRPHIMFGSRKAMVVDHATKLSPDQQDAVHYHQAWLRKFA